MRNEIRKCEKKIKTCFNFFENLKKNLRIQGNYFKISKKKLLIKMKKTDSCKNEMNFLIVKTEISESSEWERIKLSVINVNYEPVNKEWKKYSISKTWKSYKKKKKN